MSIEKERVLLIVNKLVKAQKGQVIFGNIAFPDTGYILSLVRKEDSLCFEIKYRLHDYLDIARMYFRLDEMDKMLEEYIWRIRLHMTEYIASQRYITHTFSLQYIEE